MDRKKAQKHLDRLGLSICCPKQAQAGHNQFMADYSAGLLSATGGLCSAYRVTSAYGLTHNRRWIMRHIYNELNLKDALLKAAQNHPLYNN